MKRFALRMMLKGRTVFRAEDGFPELFMDECRKTGAVLYDLVLTADSVQAECESAVMEKVRLAAALSGMTVRTVHSHGLPHLHTRYSKRIGLLVGLLLSVFLFIFLSSFIWVTDVTGNEKIRTEQILVFLEREGVRIGTPKRKTDAAGLAYKLETGISGISWAAVNIHGCRLTVEIRESVPKPRLADEKEYCNLVASADGEIVRADIYTGAGQLRTGQPVVKGDLLVSGVIELANGCRFVCAKADITARTKTVLRMRSIGKKEVLKPLKCKDVYLVRFFHILLPFGLPAKADAVTTQENRLCSAYTVYPIGIVRKRYTVFREKTETLDRNRLLLRAAADFSVGYYERYADTEIISMKFSFCFDEDAAVSAETICVENIAEKRKILLN